MKYHRVYIKGGTYFFTIVTFQRKKILNEPENIQVLRDAFEYIKKKHPFHLDAYVILPEHIHLIITLPENDDDFSTRIRLMKSYFSRNCNNLYKQLPDGSRKLKNEQLIWQRRFWEHVIRDNKDYKQHVEYIHYNPVTHGLVSKPIDWVYSSFRRFVKDGIYDMDWGAANVCEFDQTVGRE